jgi:hypothetical protein
MEYPLNEPDKEDEMSQEYSSRPYPSLNWDEVWSSALLRPSERTYDDIIHDPRATTGRAIVWLVISSLVGFIISLVIQIVVGGALDQLVQETNTDAGAGTLIIALICGAPLVVVFSIIGLAISTGITQFVAGALGGNGTFEKLFYAFAAFTAPLSLVSSLLGSVPLINCLAIPLGFYAFYLEILAIRTVNQFSWGKAITTLVLVFIGILVVIAFVAAIMLAIIGPTLGNVFSNIMQELPNQLP